MLDRCLAIDVFIEELYTGTDENLVIIFMSFLVVRAFVVSELITKLLIHIKQVEDAITP